MFMCTASYLAEGEPDQIGYLDDLWGLQQVELRGPGNAFRGGPHAGGPGGSLELAEGLRGVWAGGVHHQIKHPAHEEGHHYTGNFQQV